MDKRAKEKLMRKIKQSREVNKRQTVVKHKAVKSRTNTELNTMGTSQADENR